MLLVSWQLGRNAIRWNDDAHFGCCIQNNGKHGSLHKPAPMHL